MRVSAPIGAAKSADFRHFALDLPLQPVRLATNNGLFSVPAPLFDRSPEDQWGFYLGAV
jgi:hypothetical protein